MTGPLRQKNLPLRNLCLVTAVDIEFKTATALLDNPSFSKDYEFKICIGHTAKNLVTVLQCGMGGRGFAEWLVDHLKLNNYDALTIAGLAGGLDDQLKTGDTVIYRQCLYTRADPGLLPSKEKPFACDEIASIRCDDKWSELIFELLQKTGGNVLNGQGLTVDRIITEAGNKKLLGTRFNALAVDMESYDVLRICSDNGLAATAMRVISDEVSSDLPDFNFAAKENSGISLLRMGLAMAARPVASYKFLSGIAPVIRNLKINLNSILNA